jgi:hypothetical protein
MSQGMIQTRTIHLIYLSAKEFLTQHMTPATNYMREPIPMENTADIMSLQELVWY